MAMWVRSLAIYFGITWKFITEETFKRILEHLTHLEKGRKQQLFLKMTKNVCGIWLFLSCYLTIVLVENDQTAPGNGKFSKSDDLERLCPVLRNMLETLGGSVGRMI